MGTILSLATAKQTGPKEKARRTDSENHDGRIFSELNHLTWIRDWAPLLVETNQVHYINHSCFIRWSSTNHSRSCIAVIPQFCKWFSKDGLKKKKKRFK